MTVMDLASQSLSSVSRDRFPKFRAGDTVDVSIKISKGGKERIQHFQGIVIQRRHPNTNGETFTVRKIVDGVAVERILPILSPIIDKIEVKQFGKVRRARLYYLRKLKGKNARVKQRFIKKKVVETQDKVVEAQA